MTPDGDWSVDWLAAVAHLMLVSLDLQGMSVVPALTKTTQLFKVLQDPTCLPTTGVAMDMMAGLSSSGPRGAEPHPRKPARGPFYGCHLGMRMELSAVYLAPVSIPEFKRWSLGGRSHTLTTLIVHRPVVRLVTSPHSPLVAPVAVSIGDLAMVPSSSSQLAAAPQGALVPGESVQGVL
jgi:hypothetical protein